ncbi:hypothetical protein DM01DRAFT_1334785 [Hesseltinella vesiculosa]|uniref:Uncharacterized protein n=1 Tax=Hesseltinella vesiculosa TaxID=101127 RepID=A0A1X2GLA7_9FUNG|nr:hypothetical protein DM01DRAFT_1334785 [Hesseltinella vesiculosa]
MAIQNFFKNKVKAPAATTDTQEATEAQVKFLMDVMRTTKTPDVLGQFLDPMGKQHSGNVGIDVTNTRA